MEKWKSFPKKNSDEKAKQKYSKLLKRVMLSEIMKSYQDDERRKEGKSHSWKV